ncbi:cupin domain-containing protein [Ahniella affigens]|uniref:Cupin domain-containing protein n=1 Tax=Ahniella affigens TaxID=2021234 RepID=A0A2P1PYT1_9GAMM|nr:cupin domain-containing protein [Ahniella affigens]AVP99990.1 cupin domain-containing protein [Ahniella affigens]
MRCEITAGFLSLLLLAIASPSRAFEPSEALKVTPLLKTTTSWDGAALKYPEGEAEITGLQIEIAVGAETGWHLHPVSSFGMVLEGELEVSLRDGRKKLMKAGESLAEVVNTEHNGRNVGKVPVKLLVFYAGAKGVPLTIKSEPAKVDAAK